MAALAGRQAMTGLGRPSPGGSTLKTPSGSGMLPIFGMSPTTGHGVLTEAAQLKRLKVNTET